MILVEDDPHVRRAVRYAVGDRVVVVEAATAAAGIRAVGRERWAGIIADYGLPDGTAVDVLRAAGCSHGAGPMLVLTGYDPDEIARAEIAPAQLVFKTQRLDDATVEVRSKEWHREDIRAFIARVVTAHDRRIELARCAVHAEFGHLEIRGRAELLLDHLAVGGTVESFAIACELAESSAKQLASGLLERTRMASIEELVALIAVRTAELA